MCGVVGVLTRNSDKVAVELGVRLLLRLQHRGQDGAGVVAYDPVEGFENLRGLGLIDQALKDWVHLSPASVAIAHTRYATTGLGGVAELQPFVQGAPKVAMAHNGNIVNTRELEHIYGLSPEVESDLEHIQQAFLKIRQEWGFERAVARIHEDFVGSYAVVGIENDGTLFGFRDSYGIRPLFLARSSRLVALASETTALTALAALEGCEDLQIEELAPAEWVRVSEDLKIERGFGRKQDRRFCMFEMVYFSSPQSEYLGKSVYSQRFELGRILAEEIKNQSLASVRPREVFDYVVPVPETSRAAAIAVAESLEIPYREYLVKNPYVSRTFILPQQEQRLKALEAKLSLIGPEIKGRNILLVDDSVVRGNTSRLMAKQLREGGASRVALASTCPPIRFGCFYGIDFPDQTELVASQGRNLEDIQKALGVDELFYLSIPGLKKALDSSDLCMACLDGNYPSKGPSFDKFLNARRDQRGGANIHV